MSNKEFNILVNIDDRRGIQDNLMPQQIDIKNTVNHICFSEQKENEPHFNYIKFTTRNDETEMGENRQIQEI